MHWSLQSVPGTWRLPLDASLARICHQPGEHTLCRHFQLSKFSTHYSTVNSRHDTPRWIATMYSTWSQTLVTTSVFFHLSVYLSLWQLAHCFLPLLTECFQCLSRCSFHRVCPLDYQCYHKWQKSCSFKWLIFHCIYTGYFLYSFSCWGTQVASISWPLNPNIEGHQTVP